MKKLQQITFIVTIALLMHNCSSVKIIDSWKAEQSVVDIFKQKKVLVIARTSSNPGRYAFEKEIADELRKRGIKATESYSKAPKIYPNKELTEERVKFIKEILESEGFNAVILTVIKDKKVTERVSQSGIYVGASYGNYYPGYYGGFYDYYRTPYAYGSYYDSFGGFIPTGTSTSRSTDYVLETVAYNLDEETEKQLVAVVTTNLNDPKNAHKTAEKYVDLMFNSLGAK